MSTSSEVLWGGFAVFIMSIGQSLFSFSYWNFSYYVSKNFMLMKFVDISVCLFTWIFLGWGMSSGDDLNSDLFIGNSEFASINVSSYTIWFYQLTLLIISLSILSNSAANFMPACSYYLIPSIFYCIIVYPFIHFWVWTSNGFASPYRSSIQENLLLGCGVIDTSGSSVIYMTGGCATISLILIFCNGDYQKYINENEMNNLLIDVNINKNNKDNNTKYSPRTPRSPRSPRTNNSSLLSIFRLKILINSYIYKSLGMLLVIAGALGNNGINNLLNTSDEVMSESSGKRMVNSLISIGASMIVGIFSKSFYPDQSQKISLTKSEKDIETNENDILNHITSCIMSSLVAISAGCSVVNFEGAFFIGVISAFIYLYSSKFLRELKFDDCLRWNISTFFVNGIWGMVAVGIFASSSGYESSFVATYINGSKGDRSSKCAGILYGGDGSQLGIINLYSIIFQLSYLIIFNIILYYINLQVQIYVL
jgi:Amt family ammonium transporter